MLKLCLTVLLLLFPYCTHAHIDLVKKFVYDDTTDLRRNDLILLDLAHKSIKTNGSSLTPHRGTSKLSG